MRLLEWYAEKYGDQTQQTADQLLNELQKEEVHKEQKEAKKKEKKKRQKIKQLAEKEGVSIEEMERRLAEQKEEEKR